MEERKAVFTYGLAKVLLRKGFRIVDIGLNQKRKRMNEPIYFFEVTPGLLDTITAYTELYSDRKNKKEVKYL